MTLHQSMRWNSTHVERPNSRPNVKCMIQTVPMRSPTKIREPTQKKHIAKHGPLSPLQGLYIKATHIQYLRSPCPFSLAFTPPSPPPRQRSELGPNTAHRPRPPSRVTSSHPPPRCELPTGSSPVVLLVSNIGGFI